MISIKNMTIGDWGNTKALFSIEIESIWISGFKIIKTNNEFWVGMPSRQTKDGEYKDIVGMIKEKKELLDKVALNHYSKLEEGISNYK